MIPVRSAKPAAPPLSRTRGAQIAPRSLERQNANDQRADAGEAEQPEPLVEQDDPDRDRQERRRATSQRVDQRQVAPPVGRGKEREVHGLERAGHHRQHDRVGPDGRPADRQPSDEGDRADDGGPRRHADRRRSQGIARGLEQDVPRDVEHGRGRNKDEDEGIHGPILAAHECLGRGVTVSS